ncbi:MAG: T9SS type A sorting domain-containing protein [Chitinophagaceae bacterium]|nr:T9SS type A sorting domain-containing protein [Chitinophagaceae bacterium]
MKFKSFILTAYCIGAVLVSVAQARKTSGVSSPAQTIHFTHNGIVDFEPNLLYLDQHPLPTAAYANKKEELNRLRILKEAELQKKHPDKKTRGLAANPTIVKGWQANVANGTPNDNDIAVSNEGKVISAVNSNIRIYNDTGLLITTKSLTSVFAAVGNFAWISDPRLLYDPETDRFVLVCFSGSLSNESKILVGFSQTNDPAANWNVYTLNGNSFNDSTWSDYPIIAVSDKDLIMTFNQVKDNVSWTIGFKQSVIWQINKADGYAGNPLQYNLWDSINYNGAPLRNICPAKYQVQPFGNKMYFLTLRNVASSNDSIFVTEIDDNYISGNADLSIKLLTTPVSYGFPPNARQKKVGPSNNYLMTNDARVLAAIYENDYVHFGSNTVNPQYMNAGVYLGTIKNISTAGPVVSADIFSTQTVEYGYPSMTMTGSVNDHKILYTFSHCITDSFAGTSILYKDALGNYSDVVSAKDGLSLINMIPDSVDRWGDYTNIQRKYNNPSRAYLAGSFGKGNANATWIAIVDNTEWPLAVTEVNKEAEAGVYPNPVTQQRFTTRFNNEDARHLRFEILDLQGKRIALMLDTYVKKGFNEFSFETGKLAAGNYIFKISTADGMLIDSHKFTIE